MLLKYALRISKITPLKNHRYHFCFSRLGPIKRTQSHLFSGIFSFWVRFNVHELNKYQRCRYVYLYFTCKRCWEADGSQRARWFLEAVTIATILILKFETLVLGKRVKLLMCSGKATYIATVSGKMNQVSDLRFMWEFWMIYTRFLAFAFTSVLKYVS